MASNFPTTNIPSSSIHGSTPVKSRIPEPVNQSKSIVVNGEGKFLSPNPLLGVQSPVLSDDMSYVSQEDIYTQYYQNLSLVDLQKECKKQKIHFIGTKSELVERLVHNHIKVCFSFLIGIVMDRILPLIIATTVIIKIIPPLDYLITNLPLLPL